jgi:hypothetical protein
MLPLLLLSPPAPIITIPVEGDGSGLIGSIIPPPFYPPAGLFSPFLQYIKQQQHPPNKLKKN